MVWLLIRTRFRCAAQALLQMRGSLDGSQVDEEVNQAAENRLLMERCGGAGGTISSLTFA